MTQLLNPCVSSLIQHAAKKTKEKRGEKYKGGIQIYLSFLCEISGKNREIENKVKNRNNCC